LPVGAFGGRSKSWTSFRQMAVYQAGTLSGNQLRWRPMAQLRELNANA
jgi:glutamate-1-semialdehyde aminotransferase